MLLFRSSGHFNIEMRRSYRLVRFLSIFGFLRELMSLEILGTKLAIHDILNSKFGLGAEIGRVRAHVGDVSGFVEALSYGHSARRRPTET